MQKIVSLDDFWNKYDNLTLIIYLFLVSESVTVVVNLQNTKMWPFDKEKADNDFFLVKQRTSRQTRQSSQSRQPREFPTF